MFFTEAEASLCLVFFFQRKFYYLYARIFSVLIRCDHFKVNVHRRFCKVFSKRQMRDVLLKLTLLFHFEDLKKPFCYYKRSLPSRAPRVLLYAHLPQGEFCKMKKNKKKRKELPMLPLQLITCSFRQ